MNQVFSQIHVRVAYLFLYLRSRYICYRKRTVLLPYRMLTHSHSATSLYNLRQSKPISDQFTSIVYIVPASNLRTGIVWPRDSRIFSLPFSHFGFENILIWMSCFRHSTYDLWNSSPMLFQLSYAVRSNM